jgi:cytochrome c553
LRSCGIRFILTIANHEKTTSSTVVRRVAAAAGTAGAAEIVANPKAAPNKIEQCIGCHGIPGYKSTFPEVYQVPMIGGQSAKYIEAALNAYKKGDRKHPSMRGIAASLSDQDIADIAAYYSQQSAATPNK